ncbi:MAG: hypothetical protein Q8K89_07495, partial [Actinomycetota bacterium]|nr:hypothetical protein [Actinomycetota bacterium]
GSLGNLPTTDCITCHASNLVNEHVGVVSAGGYSVEPRYTSAGVPLTCDTCHKSLDEYVSGAIAASATTCESCHVPGRVAGPVHGPLQIVHDSNFVGSPQVNCAGCHSEDLRTEHNGIQSTTTPSGKTLRGCAVCHSYFTSEGPRGVQVQAAISTTNDPRCSACHDTTSHPDFDSHTARADASTSVCGPCHDKDATTPGIDIKAVHAKARIGACAVCHSNSGRVPDIQAKSAECDSCHSGYTPPDPAHYKTAPHTASETGTYDGFACTHCHKLEMKLEHDKASTAPAPVSCVQCHTTRVNAFTSAWNDRCAACHATGVHSERSAKHDASTIGSGCGGSGCHNVSDV